MKKPNKEVNKFRNSVKWRNKSLEIRQRDNYLCQVCLRNLYNAENKYNFTTIEVHHITSLENDITKGLDNENLITLCKYHHIMAENGEIKKDKLEKIAKEQEKCN